MNTLNEYKLLTPLQNKNAGFSRWAYAARFGEEYFIKEFMNPVYPDEESLSETLRNSKIKSCEYFEAKKLNLYKRINDVSDGNLVRVFEFFRCDSHYYIAMPKIQSEKLPLQKSQSFLWRTEFFCAEQRREVFLPCTPQRLSIPI